MSQLPIDLEGERIQLDGAWLTRDEIAARITQMIAVKDFRISRLSDALEQLAHQLASARTVTMKVTGDQWAKLEAAGQKLGKSPEVFARDMLMQVLQSAPVPAGLPMAVPAAVVAPAPVPLQQPSPAPIVTEKFSVPAPSTADDVSPEEAAQALTIQPKRRSDAALSAPPPVMTPVGVPAAPQPSVVVDLGGEDANKPKPTGGDRGRWFNRS